MSKPTSRVDALRRQGAQHRADIGNKKKTERQLMNTMLSIGNVSRMSVDPLGLEKRKREETMRQFKADFPEFTSKSVAQGIAEGTAYVDENFSETAGDDFDQKAESHYGTISAEDAPRKPQKKPWWDIGGSPHFGGQSPVQYYEEIAAGEKPSTTYSERVLRTTFRMIDDLPRNEKGEYVINGIPYSHTELVGVLQPQVMQSLHPQLLRDQEYRDDLAKSMGYNNMDALLAQLDQQLADLQKQIEADTWKQQSSVAASNPNANIAAGGMLAQTLSGEVEGLKAIRDARDQVAAMRKGDFRSGFAEGFDLMNVASFGLTGLGADVTMLGVLNKVKDGVPLTETESRMYSIYGIQQELNSIDKAIGTSLWRGIGQGVGASAELAPQFIAGMGVANSIFKGGAIGAKASAAATRQAFNTSVWNGLKVGAMETMKVGGRAALNLGKYQVSGLIAAPLMPGTWASYAEKRQNQFKVADGQLVYTPTKAWMDLYDTLVEQSTEIASERLGGGLSDVLRSTAQQFGRALQLDRIGTAIGLGGDSKYIFGFKKSDAFRAFERNVGFSGVISEPLSEVWGDITSNVLKMAVTGNGDLSALGSLDYWKTAFAVSTIYGGALQTLTIPERVQYYKGVAELGKRKREILKKVEDKELANELEMLSIDDSLMTSAKRMADLDWSKYNIKDIAAAMDYVRTEIGLQVSMGYSEEQYNLRRFANAANYIETSAYTGIDGKDETTDIYRVVTTEGNVYTIISGDISNVEEGDDLLMAVDANGERVTLAKTKGNVLLASTVEREIQQAYTDMFSSEAVRARIVVANQLFDNIEDDLTMDQATNIASSLGIVIPRVGDTVKLVDGREVVCELLSETAPGRFSAWYVDDKGTEWTLSLAFTDILSSVDSIGVEQKLMLGENITEQAQEELMEEEIADVSGENIGTENASRFTEGNVINTPEGQGKVLYVTDGKYVVDLNMSDGGVDEMAQKEFTIEEIDALNANTVDEGNVTPEEVAAPITPTAEEVSIDDINEALNEVSDIKVIPRAKDGSVNFDAIDDPMLFAQTFADEMGSKEAAVEAVTNMRNAEAESVKKIEKASKKATSANDIVANKKKLDATKQRITFYDDVLAELTKTKEAIPETAEVVTPPEDVQPVAETIEPSAAEVAEQVVETPSDLNERASLREDDGVEVEQTTPTATTPQPTTKAGLVKNELSAKLTDRLQKTLDAMAQAMGVTVTFVDKKITTASGGKANARIIGNQVEISWKHRTAAIRFLMGHEFTHRMKDLSPEAYAAFEQSVKEYLGEEKWNKRVEELRSLYERQRVPISDELAAEEVTADFVGDMAYDEQTFDKYVEGNKENTGLLASIARIFRSIADFFRNIGDKAHAKRLDNMTKKLDALIAASSEAVAQVAEVRNAKTDVRYSIIGEIGAAALDKAEEATIRLDNLAVAREMETAGKDALAIRMATGWERGADGLWRYEVMDAEVNLYDGDEATIRKKIEVAEEEEHDFVRQSKADTKELRGRTDAYLAEMREKYGTAEGEETDAMTEDEIAHVQSLTSKEVDFEDYKERRRNELYRKRMALEAQLGYVIVKNTDAPAMIRTTRLGNILKGENAEQIFTAYPSLRDMEVQFVTDIRDNAYAAAVSDGNMKWLELNVRKTPVNDIAPYLMHEVQHAIQDIEGFAGGGNLSSLQRDEEVTSKEAYDYYRRIAGEVEARNVSARLNMSAEERRATLLSETEDVAREDQIFLRESVMQGQPKFSMQHPSLLGVHNISLDKLRKVIKMGGLANPSVAVIDVDKQTHDDYGEYSLILPKNMVDARQGKNAGTWAGDAWTPTYPQVVRRMTDDKAISRFYKDIDALPEAIRSRVHLDFDSFMEGRSANALAYWYLFEEGNAPALVYIPSRYSEDITNTVEEATNGSFSMYGLTPEERAKCLDAYIAVKFNGDRSAFEEEMQARIDRLTETIETKKSDRVKKWAQETIDSIKEYGFDYDDVAKFIRDVGYDAREKGMVNVDATITAAREQIETNNLNSDYDAWRDNLDERYGIEEYIFDGYTNSGNRRYLPHTVENASKWMKKQGRQGAVATFPSFGTFVAVSIPKMTTLESIRKRKALLGKSKEEYDAFREKWENVYYELGKKLQPDAKSFDDYGYWRLIEAVENKNPREFIKKQYGIELSEKDMAQLNEMLDAIRTEYPARYFETKFERPLQLSDFVAAVVPNDIPLDVESRLRGANVEIFEYEKGNSNSRTEAMQKASHVENVRFSLQTFDTVTNYITFEARAFGITTPIFVAENAEEFKQALREIGVRNVDDYENVAGIYDPDNDAIYIRADISEYERVFFETLLHENTHAVTRSIRPNLEAVLSTLNEEDILAYRDSEMSSIYKNDSALSVLNEIISYFVEEIPQDKLIDYYQGEIDIEDNILSDFKISLIENELKRKFIAALRPVILENLEIQKRNYNERKGKAIVIARGYMGPYGTKDEKSKSGSVNTEHEGRYDARGERKAQGGVLQKVGAQEDQSVTPTRYSVRKDDMPFFYDEGGDVIIFDDLEDAPAEYISSAEGKPRITEETLSTFIKGRHSKANMRIREETDDLKKAMKARYLDEKRKRLDGIANARTNSGKVAVILGDTAVETLSLEDQALVMIAEGEVHIVWDADKNGRKGIAGELGLSDAERTNYKSITKGATVTFEKFVHQWWESIGGYEKGIDTQDLRNALIEALSEAPTAKRAIEILRDKYDTVQREYDDAIYDIEASEERELANEEARYKQELEDINDPTKRRAYVRHYEQSVAFFDDMGAVQHTVRGLESKISRLTRDAAVAQRRYERRVEAIKARNKDYTQERLDKQFEKNKAFLRKVLDERNEKLRKMAEGINEAKNAIKETLQGSKAIKYNSREVQSLIASIDGVRTAKGLKEVYSKAERIILNAGIRQARNDMQRLLNMRLPNGQMVESWVGTQVREGRLSAAEGRRIIADMWRGVNSRGVKVSKFVDEETAKVMKYLRDNLVLPYAKRHYQKLTDADGNTTKVLSPDLEITTDVASLKGNNDMRIAELEAKLVDGTLKADERTELDARRLYNSYLNVVDYKQQIEAQDKAIEEQRELIATQREGVESGKIDASVPKESYNILSTMYEALNDLKKSYFDKIAEFNTKVEEVLSNGRDALKEFREAQEQHRVEVIRMGLNAIGGTRVSGSPTALQKAKAVLRGSAHNSYWTFQTTLREIDRFAPNGEGEFYNYFMRMSNKATDEFISMQHAHLATLGTYIHSLWPKTKKKTAYYAFIEIMEKANTTALPTITVYERIDKDGKGHEPVRHAMCISNAMYTIAMWNQAQYRKAMQKRGITQEVINNLETAITEVDDRYLKFMKLVIEKMLPDTRLEYDKVHRQLFGASMENIDNYFPAKIKREYLQEDMQVAENTLPSTITGSIISRRSNNAMPDIMQSFFAVLEGHLQNMDNWASTAPLIMDMQTLLSNAKFRDLLNSYMPGAKGGYGSLSEIFRKACAIRAGVYKSRQAVSDDILLGMTKGFATANISFRISTAIKQLSAAPLFAAYVADPRCAKIWAKYTWRGPLYKGKKMIEAAAEISPAFRERWESKTMGSEVLARKSREAQYGVDTQDIGKSKTRKVAEDSMDLLKKVATDVGMYPNVYVDAWVCATGVLTIYEYELSRMTNGKPEEATEEMKEEARYKAETFMNATQQSADSAFLSEVQMQRSVVTSGLTMYANASYGLHRLRLAGFQELGKQMFNKEYREAVRERYGEGALGDARKKAIYQIIAGVLGDVNFYLMGLLSKSVWALLSGGEDDEDDNPIWDWWEVLKDLALTMSLNGYVGGGSVSSYFQGYDLDVTPAFNEFLKDLEKIPIWKKDEDGEKSWDGVNMWAAASIIAKFRFGVDPDTILNIILGIEGIIKQEGWEAGMKLFNEPQSAIKLVAGRRRKGETVQEYVDRRMRLEVIGSVPSYGEMFDEDGKFIGQGKLEKGFDWGFFKFPVGGAKDYKVRNLFKEFNERQANAVMRHVMTPMQRADIERTNEAYAKVCADLGWKTTTDPGDKGVDKTQKRYVYPQGLSAGRYKNLKKIAKEISDIRKELNRFAGSDEGYAEKLKEQHELKNKLIDKYDEFK